MKYCPSLEEGTLIKRYKRFLADIEKASGELVTIHCPNTGAMTGCAEPGFKIYYSTSDNPKRKYPNTWELAADHHGQFIGINSAKANHIVREALQEGRIPELSGYENIKAEVPYGKENSRIDFLLSNADQDLCYVEVKSVTLLDESFGKGRGFFPDAVSLRAQKHVRELIELKNEGHRAVLFFCVQHDGIKEVSIASHIDPAYLKVIVSAQKQGLEFYAYRCEMDASGNTLKTAVPFSIGEGKGE